MRALAAASGNFGNPVSVNTDRPSYGSEEGVVASDLDRVAELRQNLLERQTVYSYCASYYGKRYYALTIPSIVVTTAISVLGAVWPYDGTAETAGRVTISLLGALATVITACLSLFKFQSKMDIFYNAAQQIDGMVSRLSFLTKYRMGERITRNELQNIITGIEDKLNEVRSKVPPIPNDLYLAGCREEDGMIELRKKRAEGHSRREGWTEGSQVFPDMGRPDESAPGSPKEPAPETPKKQWC